MRGREERESKICNSSCLINLTFRLSAVQSLHGSQNVGYMSSPVTAPHSSSHCTSCPAVTGWPGLGWPRLRPDSPPSLSLSLSLSPDITWKVRSQIYPQLGHGKGEALEILQCSYLCSSTEKLNPVIRKISLHVLKDWK